MAGKAVLAGLRNQIFLPGIDPETGAYASAMLGPATVLSRTEVDAVGDHNDAERVSESRRDLRQAPELRRMVKYRQGIAIIDTADPILFRFLPRADHGDLAAPPQRAIDPPQTLSTAVGAMNTLKAAWAKEEEERTRQQQAQDDEQRTPMVVPIVQPNGNGHLEPTHGLPLTSRPRSSQPVTVEDFGD